MLYRFRTGDANMRLVWACSRNDAIGNFAVMLAAAGVFGTGSGWPDVIVAAIMGGIGLSGGLSIVRQARVSQAVPSVRAGRGRSRIMSGHDHQDHAHDNHDHGFGGHDHGHAHGPGV